MITYPKCSFCKRLLLENVIKDFVLNTKRLERFSMRQSLCLVLKVKPFKIFTAIHNSKIFVRSEDRAFNYEPIFDCLLLLF